MKYRLLGRTGLRISPLCLGAGNFSESTDQGETDRIINLALDSGINIVDMADNYWEGETEKLVGKVLKVSGRRQEVLICTKGHYPMGDGPNDQANSRHHLIEACENSLRRLQTDYIDLYLLHRRSPEVHIEETLAALTHLIAQGKVRYIGCSTHPAWAVAKAVVLSEMKGYARFVVEQPPYNLLDRRIENELVPMCIENDLGIISWSPMAQGLLAGRYSSSSDYPDGSRAARRGGFYADRVNVAGLDIGIKLAELARSHSISPAQLAVLWVKDQPGITAPIIGPRTVEHLEHLIPVLDLDLSDDMREACDELVSPGTAVTDFHNTAPWMKMSLD